MIKGLDGLRGTAFLMIYFFHVGLLPFGWYSIQLFFVLSGFLITPILVRTKENHRDNYYSHFIVRRAFRIFPLFYFYLIFLCIVSSIMLLADIAEDKVDIFLEQLPYAFIYVFNFARIGIDHVELPLFGHVWSLSVEEQFYLLWPFLILFSPVNKLRRVLLTVVLLGPVFRGLTLFFFMDYFAGQASPEDIANRWAPRALFMMPWTHFDAFALGALFAMIRVPYAKQQFYGLLILLPIVGTVTEYMATGKIVPGVFGFNLLLPDAYKTIWGYSALNYLFALLVYLVAREHRFLGFLEKRFIRGLGKVSYGAYIYHFPLLMIGRLLAWEFVEIEPGMVFGPVELLIYIVGVLIVLMLTVGVSILSFNYLEMPFMRMRERYFGEKRASPRLDLDQMEQERQQAKKGAADGKSAAEPAS